MSNTNEPSLTPVVVAVTLLIIFFGGIISAMYSSVPAAPKRYVNSQDMQIWEDCMAHSHWDTYQDKHGYWAMASKSVAVCGAKP